MTHVVMVIKTTELAYDDRLRKECESLMRSGHSVTVACSLVSNEAAAGQCFGAVKYRSFHLRSRKRWPDNRFAALHMLEFGWHLWRSGVARRANVLWIHDPVAMFLLPWAVAARRRGVRLIWDQHELPPQRVLANPVAARIFGWCCARADLVIEANQPRLDLLRKETGFAGEAAVLNNFADGVFSDQPRQELLPAETSWLDGDDFVLLQSGGYPWRHFEAVVDAVMSVDWPANLRVILPGQVHEPTLNMLAKRYPNLESKFLLVGMVPQMQLARFVDSARASLIFYATHITNQQLCEANRLYQALCRGCPVIVGDNPPMRSVVEATGAGVVLDNDGADSVSICEAVKRVTGDSAYALRARVSAERFRWNSQDDRIASMVKR